MLERLNIIQVFSYGVVRMTNVNPDLPNGSLDFVPVYTVKSRKVQQATMCITRSNIYSLYPVSNKLSPWFLSRSNIFTQKYIH